MYENNIWSGEAVLSKSLVNLTCPTVWFCKAEPVCTSPYKSGQCLV